MARLLSDDCLSLARLIAGGASCSELETDDGRDKDEVLRISRINKIRERRKGT